MSGATASGTRAFLSRIKRDARDLGGLALSPIGIGTYLGNDDDADDARYTAAVVRAVEQGLNVIDTAINYRSQRSERAIGAALRQAFANAAATRDQLVIATKGGYLPFDGGRPRHLRHSVEDPWRKP